MLVLIVLRWSTILKWSRSSSSSLISAKPFCSSAEDSIESSPMKEAYELIDSKKFSRLYSPPYWIISDLAGCNLGFRFLLMNGFIFVGELEYSLIRFGNWGVTMLTDFPRVGGTSCPVKPPYSSIYRSSINLSFLSITALASISLTNS